MTKEEQNLRDQLAISLASLTTLITAGVLTIEQTVQHIERIRKSLGRDQDEQKPGPLALAAIEWLRGHDRPEGPKWQPIVLQGGRPDDGMD